MLAIAFAANAAATSWFRQTDLGQRALWDHHFDSNCDAAVAIRVEIDFLNESQKLKKKGHISEGERALQTGRKPAARKNKRYAQ